MRRRAAALLGILTFCAALAGFLYVGVWAQNGEVRVLVASRTIPAGEVLQASTADLSPGGALVHLSAAAQRDTIPEQDYRAVQGAIALVTIPEGALILRQDVAVGSGSTLRQLSLDLSFMPLGLTPGDRVDLFAVSGSQAGSVAPGANLCGNVAAVGCVVPLAQAVAVIGADQASHTITISVSPVQVAPWLLLDATEPIWAVPAGAVTCEGTEQAISDPYQALLAIREGTAAKICSRPVAALGTG
ncbi:MAG: SAF domain-containing protein [Candidatus Dormiibacterota bacterium]